ncbi:MAG: hypothetical protein WC480_03205 [Patescibacteria group bacterium]
MVEPKVFWAFRLEDGVGLLTIHGQEHRIRTKQEGLLLINQVDLTKMGDEEFAQWVVVINRLCRAALPSR